MAETFTAIQNDAMPMVQIWQWDIDDTDTQPTWRVSGVFSDIVVQLMTIESGTPTVGIEGSLNRPDDGSISVWRLTDVQEAVIALSVAGAGKQVLQSPYLIRPRIVAGTGRAVVRIKVGKITMGG